MASSSSSLNNRKLLLFGPESLLFDTTTNVGNSNIIRTNHQSSWDLFLDLLMVAAATAVADGLKRNPTWSGVGEFWMLYFLFVNGWNLYTNQITSRFKDWPFLHYALPFFIYFLGTAIMVVNTTTSSLVISVGATIQRFAIMWMLVSIHSYNIPQVRGFCRKLGIITNVVIVLFLSAIWFGDNKTFSTMMLWMTIIVELATELIILTTNDDDIEEEEDGKVLVVVDMNNTMEHTKHRMSNLIVLMLGESMITTTLQYRNFIQQEDMIDIKIITGYYYALFWTLVLLFFFMVFYFNTLPSLSTTNNKSKKNPTIECLYVLFHKLVCGCVLTMSVAISLSFQSITKYNNDNGDASNSTVTINTMWSLSIGGSLLFLFCIRIIQYYDNNNLHESSSTLWMNMWLITIGMFSFLPFVMGLIFLATTTNNTNTISVISSYAILLFMISLIDAIFAHYLGTYNKQQKQSTSSADETRVLTLSPPRRNVVAHNNFRLDI